MVTIPDPPGGSKLLVLLAKLARRGQQPRRSGRVGPRRGAESGREQGHQLGRKHHAGDAQDTEQRRRHRGDFVREPPRIRIAAARDSLAEGRHEGGGECALGKQIAQQIGNAKSRGESIHRQTAAEQRGKNLFAQQAQQPAAHHRQTNDAGRLGIQAIAACVGGNRSGCA